SFNSEREILYQVLFDMKKDMNDMKKLVNDIITGQSSVNQQADIHFKSNFISHSDTLLSAQVNNNEFINISREKQKNKNIDDIEVIEDEEEYHVEEIITKPLSLEDMERQMIKTTLDKHKGKRKAAADELKISERTLYRKIREYGIE
ncbi:MAG: helix-turn-helix domain-containing protein, partial [Paludibacter sp.]|nr:helix-turn-helix domain-containing protein [Paludibacter sp.]